MALHQFFSRVSRRPQTWIGNQFRRSAPSTSPFWHGQTIGVRFNGSMLVGNVDRFGSVHVLLDPKDVIDIGAFEDSLRTSVSDWRAAGRCAAWIHVPNAAGAAVPALLEAGFDWHHSKPASGSKEGYSMLVAWLSDDRSNNLPLYPSTQVGVGGLVMNPREEVLLMKERVSVTAQAHGLWKLPGGLVDPGEDLVVGAAREVQEETGVKAKAEGILCIHHRHGYRHGVSDLYFTVKMEAETEDLNADPRETVAVTWMPLTEALSSPEVMGFNRRILSLAKKPVLAPHHGKHGSTIVKTNFYLYASTSSLDPMPEE